MSSKEKKNKTEFEHVFHDDSMWSTMKAGDEIKHIAEVLADLLRKP